MKQNLPSGQQLNILLVARRQLAFLLEWFMPHEKCVKGTFFPLGYFNKVNNYLYKWSWDK